MKTKYVILWTSCVWLFIIMLLIATVVTIKEVNQRKPVFKWCSILEYWDKCGASKIEGVVILRGYDPGEIPSPNSFVLAAGFSKPLKEYFGFEPTDLKGRPIPVEPDRTYIDKLDSFHYEPISLMGALGASIGYVVKENKHYVCYLVGIDEEKEEIFGRHFVSAELKKTLLDLFKKYDLDWKTWGRK
jgi:hypothetical protein